METESTLQNRFPPPPVRPRHPVDVGMVTEAVILAELMKHGYPVMTPHGPNHRYDLAIDLGEGRMLRIQCKTGRLRKGAVFFAAQSVRTNMGPKALTRTYQGEIDFFGVYCPDTGEIYMVPVDEVPAGGSAASLRVDHPLNNQMRCVRWARDFQLPRWSPGN